MYIRLRHITLFLALICCLVGAVASEEWSADNLPIPYLENRTRYVSDPDGILRNAERDSVDYYLGRLEKDKQVQSLFVIVRRVKDGDAFRMAQDLGNKLGVGDKKTRRGLVIVIAVDDRKYFIAPGMGLEGELTDVDCDDIARACIVKYMRKGVPGEAVVSTSRAIYNKVSTGKTGVRDIDEGTTEENIVLLVFLTLLFFSVPLYMLIRLVLIRMGVIKPSPQKSRDKQRHHDDDWFPPFIFGGGGGLGHGGGGFSGGSFGGGSFGGGGSGGSW